VGCEIPPRHTRGRLRRPRVQTETKFYCHNRALMPRPALQCYDFVCAMPPGAQSIDQASSRSDRDDSNVFGGVDHAPIRLAQRVWGRLGQKIGFRISPNTSPESISIHWPLLLSFLHHARRQELPRQRWLRRRRPTLTASSGSHHGGANVLRALACGELRLRHNEGRVFDGTRKTIGQA
jgi:hypothetical protein